MYPEPDKVYVPDFNWKPNMKPETKCPIRPLADRVVVKRAERRERVTIVESPGGDLDRGVVLAVGPVGKKDSIFVFNYPAGNVEAQRIQEANAEKIGSRKSITVPRSPTGNWPGVECVEAEKREDVKVGDVVLFPQYSGNDIEVDGETYTIIREDDLLAVVPPKEQ